MLAPPLDAPVRSPALLNRERAARVLASRALDALVAADPVNVHYLSGHGAAGAGGIDAAHALLPASETSPPALVVRHDALAELVASGGTWMPRVVAYGPREASEGPVRTGALLTPLEQQWLALRDAPYEPLASSAAEALARTIREADLERATIGLDDVRLEHALRAAGLEHVRFVPAVDAFREIRRVKSPGEVELLRIAARIVETACLEAAAQIHEGAEWPDIENHFHAELASRGGRGVRLGCGAGALPALRVRRGEPTAMEAVGHHRGYHAAFGRTVVVGAPSAELLRRNAAMQRGCLEAFDAMRPGMRASELETLLTRAVRAHGFPEFRRARVRTLGLEADDEADASAQASGVADPPLEPGTAISVSLPCVEFGWGAVLLADTLLVGERGAEPLTSMQMDLLVAP